MVKRQAAPGEDQMKHSLARCWRISTRPGRRTLGGRYQPTTVVLFTDQVDAEGCGIAGSATGPFYCPATRKVYIDLGFYRELEERFGAPGDFAQAYVLAHEVGHHVQALLGIESQVRRAQQSQPQQANALSVRMELQADCFAGVWGHAASQPAAADVELETGDVEEGLRRRGRDRRRPPAAAGRPAASRPRSSRTARRRSASQWFRRGLESGNPDACDTFGNAATW